MPAAVKVDLRIIYSQWDAEPAQGNLQGEVIRTVGDDDLNGM
jgi:hypothetical protein